MFIGCTTTLVGINAKFCKLPVVLIT